MTGKYSWSTYLKHAFHNAYNYGALGLAVGLTLILKNEAFLYLGAGLEVVYLYMMSGNPRFQRHIDSVLHEEQELDIEPLREHLWPMIGSKLRIRYEEISRLAERLNEVDIKALSKSDPFFHENKRKVLVLLANYLKLAVAVTRYATYLAGINPPEIEENVARLKSEMEHADERVQAVKKKNIDVLQKRLDKVAKAKANSDYLTAQMETIEDTMSLVVDQTITLSDPKGMGTQIDNVLFNLQETELIAAEMESFTELEASLDDDIWAIGERE